MVWPDSWSQVPSAIQQMWSVGGETAPSSGTISLEALSEGELLLKTPPVPCARLNSWQSRAVCSAYLRLSSYLQLMCYTPVLCGEAWFSAGIYCYTPVTQKLFFSPRLSGYESLILNSVVLLACGRHKTPERDRRGHALNHPCFSNLTVLISHCLLPSIMWEDSNTGKRTPGCPSTSGQLN